MPKCGVCGGGISLTVVPHAELCDDDRKTEPINHLRQEKTMSKCQDCGIEIPTEQLSGLGTCPKCVRVWINDYKALHDRRYGKRVKV